VHLELPDTMTVEQVDVLTRRLEARVYLDTGVILTAVGVYSYNTKDDEAAHIRNQVQKMALSHEWVLQIHGFHVDTQKKAMRFDAVMSFDHSGREGAKELTEEIQAVYPDYQILVTPDVDITD